ncbi:type IV toxin-antitoxin system AbiEi family antitoxin [Thermomonospora umbrina]|uniref:DUF559 domain-containing protein n=1 Tax=Thermomonospora umbrina TaxID=111806 RepID=A0A3D9SSM0_9ACTN|nr:hypothetical protein [Thermomonospora umbrina]REE98607.1 hypothetical protein DFJ69_4099 [Thermomonospora umbrina]
MLIPPPRRSPDTTALTGRARELSRELPAHVVIAERAAAWVWGVDVLPPGAREATWPIEVAHPPDLPPPGLPHCRPRPAELPADDIAEHEGVRLTAPERTALDCARWLPRLEAVAALDQFLRAGLDPTALTRRVRRLTGEPHARRLREILRLSDAGAVLPGESWTRVHIMDAGLPRPATQIPVMAADRPRFFLDMGYEQYRTAVEYDGEAFHTGPACRNRDTARRTWIRTHHGWEIIVVTKEDILFHPAPFLEALATTLMHRGWTPTPSQLGRLELKLARLRRRRPP